MAVMLLTQLMCSLTSNCSGSQEVMFFFLMTQTVLQFCIDPQWSAALEALCFLKTVQFLTFSPEFILLLFLHKALIFVLVNLKQAAFCWCSGSVPVFLSLWIELKNLFQTITTKSIYKKKNPKQHIHIHQY